jgi:SPP1 gp7 family putative phage head morphogenesis protein
MTSFRVLARLLLLAVRRNRWAHVHDAADKFQPRARRVAARAFARAKARIPQAALQLALRKGDRARVEAIVESALREFAKSFRKPFTEVLTKVQTAAGTAAAERLGAQLRAAAFNPDQPRDEDGKFAPTGSSAGSSTSREQSFARNSEAIDMMAPVDQKKIKAERLTTGYAKLYHVTDIDAAMAINEEGFDSTAKNKFQGFESEHSGTYGWSSKERARFEIQRMVDSPGGGDASNWAIVELQVPESEWSRMRPDEDFGGDWKDSYKDGAAAVTGDVPKEWIVGHYVDESVELKAMAFNPDQPRDEDGKFAPTGSSGGGGDDASDQTPTKNLDPFEQMERYENQYARIKAIGDSGSTLGEEDYELIAQDVAPTGKPNSGQRFEADAMSEDGSRSVYAFYDEQGELAAVQSTTVDGGEKLFDLIATTPGKEGKGYASKLLDYMQDMTDADVVTYLHKTAGFTKQGHKFILGWLARRSQALNDMAMEDLRAAAFNPDQPRDEDGKFAPTGASGSASPEQRFKAADKQFGRLNLREKSVKNTTLPRDKVYGGGTVDGLRVRTDIPNTDSISAMFDDGEYEELPGLREVDIADLDLGNYSSTKDNDRVASLASQIEESGEISPLIVVVDKDGPYVLEGNHRARAIKKMGKTKVPAIVLVHYDEAEPKDLLNGSRRSTTVLAGHFRVAAPPKIKGFAFDKTNPQALEWVDEHVGELIDEMSRSTRERVKALVERTVEGEFDTHDLADRITELIGDESRAETIARTETMAASNGGQRAAWAQAVDDGLLNGDEEEEWITTPDDRTCPVCQPMDGERKPLGGKFNVDGEQIDGPPAHPRCRCTTGLVLRN